MSRQDIANFETQLQKLCEFWRAKLTHAELVGVLDTVKMGYHIRAIQGFEEPIPAPLKEDDTSSNSAPLSDKTRPARYCDLSGPRNATKEEIAKFNTGSPLPGINKNEIMCSNCKKRSFPSNCYKGRVRKDLLAIGFKGCGFVPKKKQGSPLPTETKDA